LNSTKKFFFEYHYATREARSRGFK